MSELRELKGRIPARDITCERLPDATWPDGRTCGPSTLVNLDQLVVHHSPDGFEWGYFGSGPADLALNILHELLPPGCDGLPPVRLFRGICSQVALSLHQALKYELIAKIPREGGILFAEEIDRAIDAALPSFWERHSADEAPS